MNKQQEVLQLIKDYVSCSTYLCTMLKDSFDINEESLLRARRLNLIPKEGVLAEGCYFNFHGGGCYFEFEGLNIDVEFGPEDRCDGFDSRCLLQFAKSTKKEYSLMSSVDAIENTIKELIRMKIIIEPRWYPNPHLLYINSSYLGSCSPPSGAGL